MDTSPAFLLDAAWLTLRVIFFGTFGLYLATTGNPRALRESVNTVKALITWPPTTLFRWRKRPRRDDSPWHERDGYEAVVYNAATDEEEVRPLVVQPDGWSPTSLLWRKKGSQPRDAMLRVALLIVLLRLLFFVAFFLGSFGVLGWLAITESPRWFVALGVLAVHQLAFARTNVYNLWLRGWLYLVVGTGVWVYLQGGAFETIAVCAVGALVTIGVLGQWHMVTSRRFEPMRRHRQGPFDPDNRRRPW